MDVVKVIQGAEHCKVGSKTGCTSIAKACPAEGTIHCLGKHGKPEIIFAMRDHYVSLLKSERSKVVQEVREWAKSNSETNCDFGGECDGTSSVDYQSLILKLDSMEPDKEDRE